MAYSISCSPCSSLTCHLQETCRTKRGNLNGTKTTTATEDYLILMCWRCDVIWYEVHIVLSCPHNAGLRVWSNVSRAPIHRLLMKCYGRAGRRRPQIAVVQSFFWPQPPCNWKPEHPQHCITQPLCHFFPHVMNPCMLALYGRISKHSFDINCHIKFHGTLILWAEENPQPEFLLI